LMYFLRGSLPWQGLQAATKKQKYQRISETKAKVRLEDLCRGCPQDFVNYFRYVRSLKYYDKPDYAGLRKRFQDLFHRQGYSWDYNFDWINQKIRRRPDNNSTGYKGPIVDVGGRLGPAATPGLVPQSREKKHKEKELNSKLSGAKRILACFVRS